MRRIRGGKPQRFGFFWTLVEETETRTDGGFLEGKKKVVSRKVVYGLDVGIKFCWRNSRKTQKREKSKKWNEIEK